MVFRILLLLVSSLVALHLARVSASESEIPDSKEYVLTLDHSNFSDTISNHDFILVEFYAPWCGHCKKLAPEYEKAASILSKHDPPVSLAKIDADNEANKELVSSYGIRGFPTLIILRNGGKVIQDYKGPRDAEGIVTDLMKQSGPASLEIKSAESAINLIGHNKVVIVGIFPEFSGEDYTNFTTVAEKLRSDYEFGHTLEARLLPRGDSSVVGPIIRLFKPFDELFVDFQDFHVEAIEKFVEEAGLPTVTVYDHDHYPFVTKLYRNKNAKAWLILNFTDEVDVYSRKYYELAKEYKGKAINFLIGSVQDTQSAFELFGVKEDQVPLFLIQTYDRKKYLKPKVEPEQIAPWIKDFEEGKLSPFKKSEPIPETNDEPVKVVVADTLEDLVLNSEKNVLLEFYAPWCGHCQKLAPILDEIAVSFENDSDLVIAKLDATANDVVVDAFRVQGYPTLYFRSSSGKIVQYDGDRSKEDITEFIQKNREQALQTAEHASLHEEL